MKAEAGNRVRSGLAACRAIDTVKMIAREAGHPGQRVEIQVVVKMIDQIANDSLDAGGVLVAIGHAPT